MALELNVAALNAMADKLKQAATMFSPLVEAGEFLTQMSQLVQARDDMTAAVARMREEHTAETVGLAAARSGIETARKQMSDERAAFNESLAKQAADVQADLAAKAAKAKADADARLAEANRVAVAAEAEYETILNAKRAQVDALNRELEAARKEIADSKSRLADLEAKILTVRQMAERVLQ